MTLPYTPPYMPAGPPALPMNQYYQSHVQHPLLDPLQYQRNVHPMPYQPAHDTYYAPPQGYGAYLPMFQPPVTQSSLGPPPSISYQANQMHFSHLPRMIYPSLSVPTQAQYVPVTQSSQSYLSQLRSAAERTAASNVVGPNPINGLVQDKTMPASKVAEKTRTTPEVIVIQDDPIAPISTSINPILDLRSKPFDFSLAHNPSVGQQYTFGNGYKPGPGQQYISKIRAMVEGIQVEDLSKYKKPKSNVKAGSKSPDMYSEHSSPIGKSNGTFGSKPIEVAFTPFYRDNAELSNEKPHDVCGSFVTHTPYAKTTSEDQSRSTVLVTHTPYTNTISEEQYRHLGFFTYTQSLEETHKQQTPDICIDLLETDSKTEGQMESRIPADCSKHFISYESKKRRNSDEMWSNPDSESLKEKKSRSEDEDQSTILDNRLTEKLDDYQPFSKRKLRAHWFPRPISSNEDFLFIGPNGTVVPSIIYATIPWENEEKCTRILMESVFDEDTLSTHSLQGICPLDPVKVEDVVTHVSDKCLVKEECVRNKIVQLCAEKALKRMG